MPSMRPWMIFLPASNNQFQAPLKKFLMSFQVWTMMAHNFFKGPETALKMTFHALVAVPVMASQIITRKPQIAPQVIIAALLIPCQTPQKNDDMAPQVVTAIETIASQIPFKYGKMKLHAAIATDLTKPQAAFQAVLMISRPQKITN